MEQQKQKGWARWRALIAEQQGKADKVSPPSIRRVGCARRAVSSRPCTEYTYEIRLSRGRGLLVAPDFEAGHLLRLLQVPEQEL